MIELLRSDRAARKLRALTAGSGRGAQIAAGAGATRACGARRAEARIAARVDNRALPMNRAPPQAAVSVKSKTDAIAERLGGTETPRSKMPNWR